MSVLASIIFYVVIGAIIGVLGRLVVPGRQPIGVVFTVLLGIVGAVVGGLIAAAINAGAVIQFLLAIAVAALLVYFLAGGARSRVRRL